MALPVWGNLEKSQIDSEKIEEAIARLIQAHEDDANAHLEVGESLYSHKASEIIDHIVASIIADKVKDGEITEPKLNALAVRFITGAFDKGEIVDFKNFEDAVVGTGSVEKRYRTNKVYTGLNQNSIAKTYTIFRQSGSLWYCPNDLKFDIHVYLSEHWGWEVAVGGEAYIKYGSGLNADMGDNTNKCFGIKFEDNAGGDIEATGFARHYGTIETVELATDIDPTHRHCFTILKTGDKFEFFIDDVKKGEVTVHITGTITDPNLINIVKNPVLNSEAECNILQFGYYFPY